MKELLVIFSHGKESGPWGTKIQALVNVAKRLGADVISVNYREDPPGTAHDQNAIGEAERRVQQLLAVSREGYRRCVLVGSSMGGYVSTVASSLMPVDGLFLLAPAFYLPGYGNQNPTPQARNVAIVHGWDDTVVPARNSMRFAELHRCDLHLIKGDHRLNDCLPKIEPLFESFLVDVAKGD